MKSRAAFRLLLIALLLLSFAFMVRRDCRATYQLIDWLLVSEPKFLANAAPESNHPRVSLSLSNIGPAAISFSLGWTECRACSDLALLKVNPLPAGRNRRLSVLGPGATTNVDFELPDTSDGSLLFCCQIEWAEKESALYRFSRQIDQPMYTLTSLLGTEWKPPWRNKRFLTGEVFASNLSVAEYFRLAYGLTREDWAEEQRVAQKRVAELRQQAARMPRRWSARGFQPPRRALSPSEQTAEQARTAFSEFCRTYTNLPPF